MTPEHQRVRDLIGSIAGETVRGEEVLYGPGGKLDSLGLVNLLADIEMAVSDEFECDIVLASERAMSRKHSPFRSLDSLAQFVCELIDEEKTG